MKVIKSSLSADPTVICNNRVEGYGTSGLATVLKNFYRVECLNEYNEIKWIETFKNRIVNEGLNHTLDVTLGTADKNTWYVGLLDSSPNVAPEDTLSDHAGWTEFTAYDETERQLFSTNAASGQSITNTDNKATFTISGDESSLGGIFLVSNSTKSGTDGIIYGAGAFSRGNRDLNSEDVIMVTISCSSESG